ncbi:MAG: ribosome-associated protein [Halieaceae bacterium]|jgi:ribosome-associated protein
MTTNEDWSEEELTPPSKSELKREMLALQNLGEKIVAMDHGTFTAFSIPDEDLRDAIIVARRINSREGRRRQLQYIGKLMRYTDTQVLQQGLDSISLGHREESHRFHELEELRDRAIKDGLAGVEEIMNQHPLADRQHLRSLIQQALREKKASKPPSAARKLFRYLKDLE